MPIPEEVRNTKGFDKNPQNINRAGRPKKLVSHLNAELKKEGYEPVSSSQIVDAYTTLLNLPLSKIKEIAAISNDDYPTIYKLVAKELMGKRGAEMLEKLLDRAYGKSVQRNDVTSDGKEISINLKVLRNDGS